MAIVGWIVLGLVAALLAWRRERDPALGELPNALVVGAFGAVLGGAAGVLLGLDTYGLVSVATWPPALLAAGGLLALDRAHRAAERILRLPCLSSAP